MPSGKNSLPRRPKKSAPSPQALVPADDKAGARAAFASEAYNKVARSAQLQLIMLESSRFFVLPEFVVDRGSEERVSNLSYSSSIDKIVFDSERGVASCEWSWSVSARTGRRKTLSVEAVYLVIYDGLTDCDSDAAGRFLRRVARFATYPYFRAHVSQKSWESGANIPILPTIAT